jgi:hypothetical protein
MKRIMKVICSLALLILVGCEDRYNKGFVEGRQAGFEEGRATGFQDGYGAGKKAGVAEGYKQGLAQGAAAAQNPEIRDLRTIDGALLGNKGNFVMFWIFAVLNVLAILCGLGWLEFRVDDPRVMTAKGFIGAIASLAWFRFFQPTLLSAGFLVAERGLFARILIEVGMFLLAAVLAWSFDKYLLRNDDEHLGGDLAGMAFGTLLFFLFLHLLVNYKILLASGLRGETLHYVEAFTAGGLLYAAYALVQAYLSERASHRVRPRRAA